jgi:hypothetical protein
MCVCWCIVVVEDPEPPFAALGFSCGKLAVAGTERKHYAPDLYSLVRPSPPRCYALAEVNWWSVVVAKQSPKWWLHPRVRQLRAEHRVQRLKARAAIRQGLHPRSVTLELALTRGAG